MTSDDSIDEQLGKFVPVTMIEDPFAHPTTDPKDNDRKAVGIPIALKRNDVQLVDLKPFFDSYRTKPETRVGKVQLTDLLSFTQFVTRYYNPETTIIFVSNSFSDDKFIFEAEAIFDYHPFGPGNTKTGAGKFRATLTCEFAVSESASAYVKIISEIPGMAGKIFWGSGA